MAAYKQEGVLRQPCAIRNEMPVLRFKGIKEVYSLTLFLKSFQPSMPDSGIQNDLNHRRYE